MSRRFGAPNLDATCQLLIWPEIPLWIPAPPEWTNRSLDRAETGCRGKAKGPCSCIENQKAMVFHPAKVLRTFLGSGNLSEEVGEPDFVSSDNLPVWLRGKYNGFGPTPSAGLRRFFDVPSRQPYTLRVCPRNQDAHIPQRENVWGKEGPAPLGEAKRVVAGARKRDAMQSDWMVLHGVPAVVDAVEDPG